MKNDFELIIKGNAAILHKLCRVYTNDNSEYEELFQEMLIRIRQSLESFRGESQLSTWLYRVCINTALHFCVKLKRMKKFVHFETDFPQEISHWEREVFEELCQTVAVYHLLRFANYLVSIFCGRHAY